MKDLLLQNLDYEHWANLQIIKSLQSISNPPEKAAKIMGHVLSAQKVWFERMQSIETKTGSWENISVSDMNEIAEENFNLLKELINKLDNIQLSQMVSYQNFKGQNFENTFIEIITHLTYHSAYHRGQVVQLIRPQLIEAPITDYIFWRRSFNSES